MPRATFFATRIGTARRLALALAVTACSVCCVSPTPTEKLAVTAQPAAPVRPPVVDPEDFEVVVQVPQGVVNGSPFDIHVKLVNRSQSSRTIQVMSCSKESNWDVKSGRVFLETHSCHGNIWVEVELNPGAGYEETLRLNNHVNINTADTAKETFQIGFCSLGGKRTYWSDRVTVRLAPNAVGRGP